jgi:dipeptidyl aminopeptidase/acylaminoacyl peptidase
MRNPIHAALALSSIALLGACAPPLEAPAETARAVQQYSVEDFYQNTAYFGASFSPDGQRLLVNSNQTGIFNVWVLPIDGGPPTALTSSTTDAILSLGYFPADERILVSRDSGGNELTHIYVRTPTGDLVDLTPGDKLKANFLGWAGDDRSFFIATNERNPQVFDVYEYAADDYKRTLFFRNDGQFEVGAISRDKRWLALVKPRTTNDTDIFLYDRAASGANVPKLITAHTGDVSNSPADFTPDSTRLLFVSDGGREFSSLRSHELATGTQSVVYEEPWDVSFARYSKGGRYLLVSVNEDSRAALRFLDAGTFKPLPLGPMPDGLVRAMGVSPDDQRVVFYASDGSVPNDVYVGDVGKPKKRLTTSLSAKIRPEDLVVPSVVRFKSYDGLEIPGVLYKPHQASAEDKAPALVMVHGGPGGQAVVGYFALVQALVNHGFVVYDINNRGSSGYGKTFFAMDDRKHGEADLGDVVASRQMLIERGYVDPERIGIIGGSYGGYMVLAALTLQPDAFKVGVDLFGISNWVRTLENTPPWWGAMRDALFSEMGDPATDKERLRRISPLFNADRIKVPLMVLQGANDPRVLQIESDEIVAAAKKNGVPVEYIVFPDEGHGFRNRANEIKGYGAVIEFLDRYLKKPSKT